MNPLKIVVDSSVVIKWLVADKEEHIDRADALLRDQETNRIALFAPELTKYEVGNVLLKGKILEPRVAVDATTSLYSLPIHFVAESWALAVHTYAIAHRHGLTYYDAAFLALASTLRATLVTDNVKHQGKVTSVPVVPLAEYGAHGTRDRTGN